MQKISPTEEVLKDDLTCTYIQYSDRAFLDLNKIGLQKELFRTGESHQLK